jgi:hypothetical protein
LFDLVFLFLEPIVLLSFFLFFFFFFFFLFLFSLIFRNSYIFDEGQLDHSRNFQGEITLFFCDFAAEFIDAFSVEGIFFMDEWKMDGVNEVAGGVKESSERHALTFTGFGLLDTHEVTVGPNEHL